MQDTTDARSSTSPSTLVLTLQKHAKCQLHFLSSVALSESGLAHSHPNDHNEGNTDVCQAESML